MKTMMLMVALAAVAGCRAAWADGDDEGGGFVAPPKFQMTSPLGGAKPGRPTAAAQAGSRIAALDRGALVIDADSGRLVRTDAAGAPVASLEIGGDAGLLVYDPEAKRAYVADRRHDRIVVVTVGDSLAIARTWRTPTEPYGLALTPDRATLLVTTIADRTLIAYDVATGAETWREPVDAEPRAVAIAPDGAHAVVTSLSSGAIQTFALAVPVGRRRIERRALPLADGRGVFAAIYLGDHLIVAPFQHELPDNNLGETASDHYGGGATPPISDELAFYDDRGDVADASIDLVEPRAVAWDPAHDALYVAGMAADRLTKLDRASRAGIALAAQLALTPSCGPDGLAIAPDGGVLVWCSFSRTVLRFDGERLARTSGPEIAPTQLAAVAHDGLVTFHHADADVSGFAGLSCGSCHLDGRSDGLSWLIHDAHLQTPILAGRLVGTAPFKWDGTAKTLPDSVRSTVTRLGGQGLSKHRLEAVVAYLESMPAVASPARDPAEVARGKQLFDSAELGCTSCHDGAKLTDRERHTLPGTKAAIDTPSLVGLAASAPYFHDGSAPTLDAVLLDRGHVHGMATEATTKLTRTELRDLRAFLETL